MERSETGFSLSPSEGERGPLYRPSARFVGRLLCPSGMKSEPPHVGCYESLDLTLNFPTRMAYWEQLKL